MLCVNLMADPTTRPPTKNWCNLTFASGYPAGPQFQTSVFAMPDTFPGRMFTAIFTRLGVCGRVSLPHTSTCRHVQCQIIAAPPPPAPDGAINNPVVPTLEWPLCSLSFFLIPGIMVELIGHWSRQINGNLWAISVWKDFHPHQDWPLTSLILKAFANLNNKAYKALSTLYGGAQRRLAVSDFKHAQRKALDEDFQ